MSLKKYKLEEEEEKKRKILERRIKIYNKFLPSYEEQIQDLVEFWNHLQSEINVMKKFEVKTNKDILTLREFLLNLENYHNFLTQKKFIQQKNVFSQVLKSWDSIQCQEQQFLFWKSLVENLDQLLKESKKVGWLLKLEILHQQVISILEIFGNVPLKE